MLIEHERDGTTKLKANAIFLNQIQPQNKLTLELDKAISLGSVPNHIDPTTTDRKSINDESNGL